MYRTCSMNGSHQKCTQNITRKIIFEENTILFYFIICSFSFPYGNDAHRSYSSD
jgi:hypothetical protein